MYIILCINSKLMYIGWIKDKFSLEGEMQIFSRSNGQPVKNIKITFIILAQYFGMYYQ